jgi:uncharacterized protein YjlB
LSTGDAALIPGGVGHCRLEAHGGLSVIGGYPAGQENWDLKRATPPNRPSPLVKLGKFLLLTLWR